MIGNGSKLYSGMKYRGASGPCEPPATVCRRVLAAWRCAGSINNRCRPLASLRREGGREAGHRQMRPVAGATLRSADVTCDEAIKRALTPSVALASTVAAGRVPGFGSGESGRRRAGEECTHSECSHTNAEWSAERRLH